VLAIPELFVPVLDDADLGGSFFFALFDGRNRHEASAVVGDGSKLPACPVPTIPGRGEPWLRKLRTRRVNHKGNESRGLRRLPCGLRNASGDPASKILLRVP
jgi:hypothetical protein